MAKYSYKIIFNEDCSDKRALVYYFGNTHNIKLQVLVTVYSMAAQALQV